jgi:hypothetical protein
MSPLLQPEWLDGFYSYSVFMRLSTRGWCPENKNVPAPKMGALPMDFQIKNFDFIETVSNGFN